MVGGFNPSEKYESQIGSSSQLLGKIKNLPNHQPANKSVLISQEIHGRYTIQKCVEFNSSRSLKNDWFSYNPSGNNGSNTETKGVCLSDSITK